MTFSERCPNSESGRQMYMIMYAWNLMKMHVDGLISHFRAGGGGGGKVLLKRYAKRKRNTCVRIRLGIVLHRVQKVDEFARLIPQSNINGYPKIERLAFKVSQRAIRS